MFEFALLAFGLGLKHSFDTDHLVAVSNVFAKVRSIKQAFSISLRWAFGHMLTASVITVLLFVFRDSFLPIILGYFEFFVALLLVALGALSVHHAFFAKESVFDYDHPHEHNKRAFGIGIIHGLASNDELLVLLTVSLGLSSISDALFGLGIFTMGVVAGMCLFAFLCSIPFIAVHSRRFHQALHGVIGIISMGYGFYTLSLIL